MLVERAQKGNGRAVEALVGRFGHPDPTMAQRAWEAVVEIGAPAEAALEAALDSGDRNAGEYAAGALGAMQARGAVGPLSEALGRRDFRRYVAAWALGEIGDPAAVPALVRALGDDDVEVRRYAARALVKLGPVASDALLEALDSPDAARRRYALRALGEIRERRAVEPLLAMRGRVDEDVLLWAVGRLGDPRGLPLVRESLHDEDWRIRLAAVQALGDLADPGAIPDLEAALEDDEWIIREWAARGLESLTGRRVRYRDRKGDEVVPYNLYR